MNFLIGCLIFCTIIGVSIFVAVFAIKKDYFNQSGHDDGKNEIFLSFKDFIDFYNLNPDRYKIKYNYDGKLCSLNVKEEYDEYDMYCRPSVKFRNKYKVKFKLFSYIRF